MGSGKSSDRIQVISSHPQAEVNKNLSDQFSHTGNQLSDFARPAVRNYSKKVIKVDPLDDPRIQEIS
jgi:hypothetical protein